MIVVTIANQKGGVGKTTVAANLAYELWRGGLTVVLFDMDAQCDLTRLCQPGYDGSHSVLDLLESRVKIENSARRVWGKDDLYIVPGDRAMGAFRREGGDVLRAVLCPEVLGEVDIVIIDTPPAAAGATAASLAASDFALVVTQPEAFSVDGLEGLITAVERVAAEENPKLQLLGILVNMVDSRRGLPKKVESDLRADYGDLVFRTSISYDTAVPISLRKRMPVRKLEWGSRVSGQLADVAREFWERVGTGV